MLDEAELATYKARLGALQSAQWEVFTFLVSVGGSYHVEDLSFRLKRYSDILHQALTTLDSIGVLEFYDSASGYRGVRLRCVG